MFGRDFSFSEFALYHYAMDDGITDENLGYPLNHAQGLKECV